MFATRSHRRSFLQVGTAGFLGLSLADKLAAESKAAGNPKADSVIFVWLSGGPATIDMWDPKPKADEDIRGEFSAIETAAKGMQISDQFPKLAKVADRMALVRSVEHGLPAHGPGTEYVTTGNLPSPAVTYPALGSLAAKLLSSRKGVPPFVAIGRRGGRDPGYLGASYRPFEVAASRGRLSANHVSLPPGFTVEDLDRRQQLRGALDRRFAEWEKSDPLLSSLGEFQQSALDILRTDRINNALDIARETKAVRDTYGNTPLARHALAARRLVEAGARFVTIGTSGWDTHSGNFGTLRNRLLPPLDAALAALIADLDDRGMLKRTLVFCGGEFGRTPQINRNAGRDHWSRAYSVLLAGGGTKSGFVLGETDADGRAPVKDSCSPDDIAATLLGQLGFHSDHTVKGNNGRPMPLFPKGSFLKQLV